MSSEDDKISQIRSDSVMRFMCCSHTFRLDGFLRLDEDGFLICPEHGLRRYGWRSARRRAEKTYPFDPANPKYIERVDYGETELGRDRAVWAEFAELHNIAGVPMTQAEHDKAVEEFKAAVEVRAQELARS